jgi:hypothetical protein
MRQAAERRVWNAEMRDEMQRPTALRSRKGQLKRAGKNDEIVMEFMTISV